MMFDKRERSEQSSWVQIEVYNFCIMIGILPV